MKTFEIKTQDLTTSKIIIDKGQMKKLSFNNKNFYLITNTTLAKLYPNIIQKFKTENVIIIKDGEQYKNLKTVEYILDELLKRKVERSDTLFALGGGVVGDIAGFVASVILRGIKLISIPTTLLAMCDSSIGGKTGFNSKYGKNLVGSFYFASYVLIDTDFLQTLNDREFKCGMGEIVKYSLIEKSCRYGEYFDLIGYLQNETLESIKNDPNYIIECCCALKSHVVGLDKKEGGLRKILNLGHTFAHPFETLSNYKNMSHGEAVSLGIKCSAKYALIAGKIDQNYFDTINSLVDRFELCNTKMKFKKKDVLELMYHDKKVVNSKINLLVPSGRALVEQDGNIQLSELEASLP